jgi:hypothetical protein
MQTFGEVAHEWRENIEVNGNTFGLVFNATRKLEHERYHVTAVQVMATKQISPMHTGNNHAILLPDMDMPGTWEQAHPLLIETATENLRNEFARRNGPVLPNMVGALLVNAYAEEAGGKWSGYFSILRPVMHGTPSRVERDQIAEGKTGETYSDEWTAADAAMELGIKRAHELSGDG